MAGCVVAQLPELLEHAASCPHVIRLIPGEVNHRDIRVETLAGATILAFYDRPATDPDAVRLFLEDITITEGTPVFFGAVDSTSGDLVPHLELESYELECSGGSTIEAAPHVLYNSTPPYTPIPWYGFLLGSRLPPDHQEIFGSHLISGAACGGDLEDGFPREVGIHATWMLTGIATPPPSAEGSEETTGGDGGARRMLSTRAYRAPVEHGYARFSSSCRGCAPSGIFRYPGGGIQVKNALGLLVVLVVSLMFGCCLVAGVNSYTGAPPATTATAAAAAAAAAAAYPATSRGSRVPTSVAVKPTAIAAAPAHLHARQDGGEMRNTTNIFVGREGEGEGGSWDWGEGGRGTAPSIGCAPAGLADARPGFDLPTFEARRLVATGGGGDWLNQREYANGHQHMTARGVRDQLNRF
jgi:hypothetical protein